ncbi:LysR family transcriptional regulator [Thalassobacillus sp. CUG 92003]|uniref:LysR family transcriptional regulator n=1 Tax=Thalassobacillus sp. CUG 92003 TaxID=2736641 RepID=UPI0015E7A2FF|nr:LysR family transcriptional regulator [Thalassobacillus sp. CUG 92003]
MELRQLHYFIEVAEREHISEAALHLHVAQSAVSRQIANLENELGVKLFEREGRNIKLTPIGKIFADYTKSALKAIDHASKQVEEYLDPDRGVIHIGFPTSLAGHLLPTVISSFKEQHPNVAFQLRQGSYHYLIDAVKKRDIDLAFLGPVPKKDPDVTSDILFTESISALLPLDHYLADSDSIILSDLKHDQFILFPEGYILRDIVVDACKQAGFSPTILSEGEDLDAIKGLVSAGLGVTLLPESTFYHSIPRHTVKLPIKIPHVRRTVGIITPSSRELAPSEKVFYKFVKEFFSRLEQFE